MINASTDNAGRRRGRQKAERLEARISQEQKALFQQAAALQGRSLSDFVIRSAQEAALRTVQKQEFMRLTAEDREVFVAALLEDAEPNERLKEAYRRYKDRMEL